MEENKELDKAEKRELRRKKRRKETIIAYSVLAAIILILGVGAFFGVKEVRKYVAANKEVTPVASEEVVSEEPIVLTEPDSVEVSEEPSEIAPEPVRDPVDIQIDELLTTMTAEQKVAALFVTSPEALTGVSQAVKAGDGTKTALEQYQIGGLVYSTKNIQSQKQFSEMLTNTVTMSKAPLFLAVSEEGGKANVIAGKLGKTAIDSAENLAKTEDGEQVRAAYQGVGSYLSEYGINLDFAPVADLLTNEKAVNKSRMFGADKANASKMVSSAVTGLQDSSVSACIKYFPGEGDVIGATKSTEKTLDDMRSGEFLTFQAGIEAGAKIIMVSDIAAPAVNGSDIPSCLSEVMMNQILRTELGYEGVIITSDLNEKQVTAKYSASDAAVMAIQAGADMILTTGDFKGAYEGLLKAVNEGSVSSEQVDNAVRRVYRIKLGYTGDTTVQNTEDGMNTGENDTNTGAAVTE